MPNPVRNLKRTDRLTARQKALVKKIREKGLKPVVYSRKKGKRQGISVHNPFSDAKRRAKVPKYRPIKARWTPQAFDTKEQSKALMTKRVKGKKKTVPSPKVSKALNKKGRLPKSIRELLFP